MADQEKQLGRSANDEQKAAQGLSRMGGAADKEWLGVVKKELAKVGITTFIDSARDITTGVVEVKVFDPTRKQERVYKFDPAQEKQFRNLLSDFLRKYGDGYREIFRHHKISIDELVPSQPDSVPEVTFKEAVNQSGIRDRGDKTPDEAPKSEQGSLDEPIDETIAEAGLEEEAVAEGEPESEANLPETTYPRAKAAEVVEGIVSSIPEGNRIRISHVTNRKTGIRAEGVKDKILKDPASVGAYLSTYLLDEFAILEKKYGSKINDVQIAVATNDDGDVFLSAEYQPKDNPDSGFFFREYALKLTAKSPREVPVTEEPEQAEALEFNQEVPLTEAYAANIISEIGKHPIKSIGAENKAESVLPPEEVAAIVNQLSGDPNTTLAILDGDTFQITENIVKVEKRFLRKDKETRETKVHIYRIDRSKSWKDYQKEQSKEVMEEITAKENDVYLDKVATQLIEAADQIIDRYEDEVEAAEARLKELEDQKKAARFPSDIQNFQEEIERATVALEAANIALDEISQPPILEALDRAYANRVKLVSSQDTGKMNNDIYLSTVWQLKEEDLAGLNEREKSKLSNHLHRNRRDFLESAATRAMRRLKLSEWEDRQRDERAVSLWKQLKELGNLFGDPRDEKSRPVFPGDELVGPVTGLVIPEEDEKSAQEIIDLNDALKDYPEFLRIELQRNIDVLDLDKKEKPSKVLAEAIKVRNELLKEYPEYLNLELERNIDALGRVKTEKSAKALAEAVRVRNERLNELLEYFNGRLDEYSKLPELEREKQFFAPGIEEVKKPLTLEDLLDQYKGAKLRGMIKVQLDLDTKGNILPRKVGSLRNFFITNRRYNEQRRDPRTMTIDQLVKETKDQEQKPKVTARDIEVALNGQDPAKLKAKGKKAVIESAKKVSEERTKKEDASMPDHIRQMQTKINELLQSGLGRRSASVSFDEALQIAKTNLREYQGLTSDFSKELTEIENLSANSKIGKVELSVDLSDPDIDSLVRIANDPAEFSRLLTEANKPEPKKVFGNPPVKRDRD